MIFHLIVGPARCKSCWERVSYGYVEHMPGKGGAAKRWRDPVTYRIHECKAEGETE